MLLPIFGADEKTLGYSMSYVLWTVGIGAVPTVLSAELAHLIRAEGYSRQASIGIAFWRRTEHGARPAVHLCVPAGDHRRGHRDHAFQRRRVVLFSAVSPQNSQESTITLSPRQYSLGDGIPGEVLAVGLPSFMISTMATFSNIMLNKIISADSNEAIAGMGIAKRSICWPLPLRRV